MARPSTSTFPLWIARVVSTVAAACLAFVLLWTLAPRAPTRGQFSAPLAPIRILDARSDEAAADLCRSLAMAADSDARLRFAGWLVDATGAELDRTPRGRFLRTIAPAALAAAVTEGVLPSLLLAQAAHESAWGRSRIANELGNLYGHARGDGWRAYPSWSASVAAHARLLGRAERYAATRAALDWRGVLTAIAGAYAEDPDYARRVGAIIRQWRLDRWDHVIRAPNA